MVKMSEPQRLLAEYVETGSEAAFRELVARYVDLVHSAAIRLVNGDAHLAANERSRRAYPPACQAGGFLRRYNISPAFGTNNTPAASRS